jgi:hypothetical protein
MSGRAASGRAAKVLPLLLVMTQVKKLISTTVISAHQW